MDIKNFITELEKIKLWLEKEQEVLPAAYTEYIAFRPGINNKILFQHLSKGYWSSVHFSWNVINTSISLRIFPEQEKNNWPVVTNFEGDTANTFANNIASFIPFQQLFLLLRQKRFPYFTQYWDTLEHLVSPFLKLFEADKELGFVK